MKTTYSKNHK